MNKTATKVLFLLLLLASSIVCNYVRLIEPTVTPTITQTQTPQPTSTQTRTPEPTSTQTPSATTGPTITSIPTIPIVGRIRPIPHGFVYLGNTKTLALGFNMSAGGSIGSLLYRGRELVDHNDYGRYIQLSLYDGNQQYGSNGFDVFGNWGWNPVQAGSKDYQGAKVLKYRTSPMEVYIKAYGKEWGKNDVDSDVIFETWAWDRDTYFEVIVRATYLGSETHAARAQEFPATYPALSLTTPSGYFGDSPFTAQPIDILPQRVTDSSCRATTPTENWVAYGNNHGLGLILALPPQPYLTGHWSVCSLGPISAPVPYVAPVAVFDNPPNAVHQAKYYLIPGEIETERAIVYDLIPHTTWTFNLDSTEGWQTRAATATVKSGVLTTKLSPVNFLTYTGLNISGGAIPPVEIRARAIGADANLCLSFLTANEPYWDLNRNKATCLFLPTGEFQTYTFEFKGEEMGDDDAITQYRLSAITPSTIDIDSLAVKLATQPP